MKMDPNDFNIRWYHKRLPDAIKTNEGRINKRDDIYWTIIREEKIANPTVQKIDFRKPNKFIET